MEVGGSSGSPCCSGCIMLFIPFHISFSKYMFFWSRFLNAEQVNERCALKMRRDVPVNDEMLCVLSYRVGLRGGLLKFAWSKL